MLLPQDLTPLRPVALHAGKKPWRQASWLRPRLQRLRPRLLRLAPACLGMPMSMRALSPRAARRMAGSPAHSRLHTGEGTISCFFRGPYHHAQLHDACWMQVRLPPAWLGPATLDCSIWLSSASSLLREEASCCWNDGAGLITPGEA